MAKQVWVVRAGRDAIYVEDFLSLGIAAIGWAKVGDLAKVQSREEIATLLSKHYPEYTKFQLSANTGQVWRFRKELTIGDSVLTYDSNQRLYHVGQVTGEYSFRPTLDPELTHTKPVKWFAKVSRDELSAATKNSLGSISTIFCISALASEEVLSKTHESNSVTPESIAPGLPVEPTDSSGEESKVLEDTEQSALEFLQDRLDKLTWQQMQDLVAGLLRAMGYKTRVSPLGPDRGKDIVASPDGFGFEPPRIIVEVKHRKGAMGAAEIRAFAGGLRNADKGLYVSTGGFTREAKYEADRANFPLTLMDGNELAKTVIEYYDRLDLETRTMLPMKKIYWPVGSPT